MRILISSSIGRDLRTRSFFRRDIEKLIGNNNNLIVLDFSDVAFISRSVADEVYNVLCDFPNVKLAGMTGDVNMMYSVVVKSRNSPRQYPDTDIKVVHLKTLEEMEDFFTSL